MSIIAAALGLCLALIGLVTFWVGFVWLTIALLRERRVRRPLGVSCSGVIAMQAGGMLVGFTFMAGLLRFLEWLGGGIP